MNAKTLIRNCKLCNVEFAGRLNKVFCTKKCVNKVWRSNNIDKIHKTQKEWRKKNIVYRREYMKKYRDTNEYRIMKQKHDRKYSEIHKIKYVPRSDEQRFKSACRAYAERHVIKKECSLCRATEKLELHHSRGYRKQCVRGVIVVCAPCHRQVIHGRGVRI